MHVHLHRDGLMFCNDDASANTSTGISFGGGNAQVTIEGLQANRKPAKASFSGDALVMVGTRQLTVRLEGNYDVATGMYGPGWSA